MLHILCPSCRLPLQRDSKVWHCANGHSHDVAREGYVNLLLVQHKHSAAPGDTADSLAARRAFLSAGHYAALQRAVLDLLAPLHAHTLLDIGCGEGYYTAAMGDVAGEVLGLDIAKPGIRLAARRWPQITWIVGSGAALPLADASIDVVCNLFTQLHVREITRVLTTQGHVLVVTPAADHLWSLRAGLFDEVRAHEPEKFLAEFAADYDLVAQREVRSALQLDAEALQQLLQMTPYAWKARPDKRAALATSAPFSTVAAFTLLLLQKRRAPPAPAR